MRSCCPTYHGAGKGWAPSSPAPSGLSQSLTIFDWDRYRTLKQNYGKRPILVCPLTVCVRVSECWKNSVNTPTLHVTLKSLILMWRWFNDALFHFCHWYCDDKTAHTDCSLFFQRMHVNLGSSVSSPVDSTFSLAYKHLSHPSPRPKAFEKVAHHFFLTHEFKHFFSLRVLACDPLVRDYRHATVFSSLTPVSNPW